MVFPFAVYFAEAMNAKIYALPHRQFLISKAEKGFELVDLTNGAYSNTSLEHQLVKIINSSKWGHRAKSWLARRFPSISEIYRKKIGRKSFK